MSRGRRDAHDGQRGTRQQLEKPQLRQPRNSALEGHVDYVDFAERVSRGVTVEHHHHPKRRHR